MSGAQGAMARAQGGAGAITHRRVFTVAIPIVLSNATVPILGAVDTGVVGQLGEAAPIGAVGVGAIILSFLYWLFGFLRMGTSGLVAQARGAGDRGEVDALLSRGLLIGAAAGLGFIALQIPLFSAAFLISPASEEVEALARSYMSIRIWGAPFAIAAFALTGWLIAMERTGAVLVLQLATNGINIALDLLFVLEFDWGVEGVAVATLIAEAGGCALGLWLCRDALASGRWRDWARVLDRTRLARFLSVNRDIMIRSLLLEICFGLFVFGSAAFGDVTLAANQVLIQFIHITAHALDGFAFAAEALVGGAMGARNRAALRRAAVLTSLHGLAVVTLMAGAFALGGGALIEVMTTSEEVRAEALRYLPWMAAAPLLGLPAWMLDGIFIGATRTADMRNGMLFAAPCYVALQQIAAGQWGNHGHWAALLALFLLRAVWLAARYGALERAAEDASGRAHGTQAGQTV